jgi:hypothetical protein
MRSIRLAGAAAVLAAAFAAAALAGDADEGPPIVALGDSITAGTINQPPVSFAFVDGTTTESFRWNWSNLVAGALRARAIRAGEPPPAWRLPQFTGNCGVPYPHLGTVLGTVAGIVSRSERLLCANCVALRLPDPTEPVCRLDDARATNLALAGEPLATIFADAATPAPSQTFCFATGADCDGFMLREGFPPEGDIALTQVNVAAALRPGTVLVTLGANDTTTDGFEARYRLLLATLREANPDARFVCMNVPNVTLLPQLSSGAAADEIFGLPEGTTADLVGLAPGDVVDVNQYLGFLVASFTGAPPPPNTTASRADLRAQAALVREQNRILARVVADFDTPPGGAVLVDLLGLQERALAHGYDVRLRAGTGTLYRLDGDAIVPCTDVARAADTVTLTFDYGGGLTCFDGIHPTPTLHAAIANLAIDAMNAKWGLGLVRVDVDAVASEDPFVLARVATLPD